MYVKCKEVNNQFFHSPSDTSNYVYINNFDFLSLCIMDTLGPTKGVQIIKLGVLIFQVSLYDKAPFGTIAS